MVEVSKDPMLKDAWSLKVMERSYGPRQGSVKYLVNYLVHMFRMRLRTRKLVLGVAAIFVLLWFMRYLRYRNLDWEFEDDDDVLGHVRNPGLKHNKWIVVTTINPPTDALRALNNLEGWKLLVVGDRKTSKTWSLTGAIYLNTAAQKKLGYKVHPLLPYDSYTRKIIGYLYAIEHGAEYIFEADDDNFPVPGPEAFQLSIGYTHGLVVDTKNLTYNPYRHFGQSTGWPRGYPLEYVGLPDSSDYTACEVSVPAIQQGLVSGDPDVDAIFRLTRHHAKDKMDYRFDHGAPPVVLPGGTFTPLNSQNTLYTGKALWALMLPTTVSDRATDIYRSFWAQRLLWLLGDHVGVFPPNANQKRNPHSNLMDSREESDVYQNIGHLARFLKSWTCTGTFFFDCASQLSHDMVTQGFWQHRDAELTDAWITDLATVGYAPPSIKTRDLCASTDGAMSVVFYPDEQNTTLPHSSSQLIPEDLTNHEAVRERLVAACGPTPDIEYTRTVHAAAAGRHDDLILVVGITSTDTVPLIEAAHRPEFPHIVYCSSLPGSAGLDRAFFHKFRLTYFNVASDRPTSGPLCVTAAMSLHHAVSGYLYISDHTWIGDAATGHPLPTKHPDMMWVTGEVDLYTPEMEGLCQKTSLQCEVISKDILETLISAVPNVKGETKFKSELRQCLVKLASDPNFQSKPKLTWLADSAFYFPSRLYSVVAAVDQVFASGQRRHDFLTPLVVECLELTVEYLHYAPLSNLGESREAQYLLPFEFREILRGPATDSDARTRFCQRFH